MNAKSTQQREGFLFLFLFLYLPVPPPGSTAIHPRYL